MGLASSEMEKMGDAVGWSGGGDWGGSMFGEEFQDPSVGHRRLERGVVGTVVSQTLSPLCRDEFRL